jgi:hypothetical protein
VLQEHVYIDVCIAPSLSVYTYIMKICSASIEHNFDGVDGAERHNGPTRLYAAFFHPTNDRFTTSRMSRSPRTDRHQTTQVPKRGRYRQQRRDHACRLFLEDCDSAQGGRCTLQTNLHNIGSNTCTKPFIITVSPLPSNIYTHWRYRSERAPSSLERFSYGLTLLRLELEPPLNVKFICPS